MIFFAPRAEARKFEFRAAETQRQEESFRKHTDHHGPESNQAQTQTRPTRKKNSCFFLEFFFHHWRVLPTRNEKLVFFKKLEKKLNNLKTWKRRLSSFFVEFLKIIKKLIEHIKMICFVK